MTESAISYAYLESPIGPLLVAGDGEALHRVSFPSRNGTCAAPAPDWRDDAGPVAEAMRQIAEYLEGVRLDFSLPLKFNGNPLQTSVWNAMRQIPYAQTISYGQIAAGLGDPSVSRAVGAACGANPLPIVIPCHRVIGADGSLTGFGGGLPIKRFLLALEQRVRPQPGLQLSLFG